MTNLTFGAKRRQEISETAGLRMAALLPAADRPTVTGEPPTTGPPPDGEADDQATDAGPAPARFRFGPAVMLDRRAVLGLVVLLLLTVAYGVQHFWLAGPQPVEVPAVAVASAAEGTGVPASPEPGAGPAVPGAGPAPPVAGPAPPAVGGPEANTVVVVDIGGRVHSPGVHTLPSGSRVADALRVAGGPLPETETKNLNLARVLTDGEQILVGEPAPPTAGGAGAGAGPPAPAAPRQPVSLNRATLEQLDTLPGVGPTLAQRIIAFRASHGSFRSLDQLRQVSGIGERTYAEIKPMLTL
ncbi:helix-hairpin-helix domain-containing protein [Kitasatospora sp. NPDC127111]|uniref:helix-hairpin-helix domain-containing protein n=1 Tax=Kitasatospora sp. NPDC127111 TaxID=3345363 RepID=UPI0036381B1A